MTSSDKLSKIISSNFHDLHKSIRNEECSYYWLAGGRGSAKSSFVAIQIILGIVNYSDANAIALRKTAKTIKNSIHSTLLWAIDILDLSEFFIGKISPPEIIYIPTGQKILMYGLDEPSKLKSLRIRKGYIKYLWLEEGEEYNSIEDIRNVRQSIVRGSNKKFFSFFSFNPPRNPNHWVNKELKVKDDRRIIHRSSYLELPYDWLGHEFFADADNLKNNNYEAYRHEYLGQPIGNPKEIIFSGQWTVKDFERPDMKEIYQNRIFLGADWGFSNDPTCLVSCYIHDGYLYVEQEAYGERTKLNYLPNLFDQIKESRRWHIRADSSRPETISYMEDKGFNISAADKWEGSVEDGIEYLKSFKKIIVHSSCTEIIKEFENYSYKIDKETKEVLPVIVDKWNHGIDALRYALVSYIREGVSILDVL